MTQVGSTENRVREFILKQFPVIRKQGFQTGDKWLETGILDSLGILDLVQFLEQEFSLQISDDELVPENFQSLGAVVNFVEKKTSSA